MNLVHRLIRFLASVFTVRPRVSQDIGTLRVYLDDERATPAGWVRTFTPTETIAQLERGAVTELSLDHDLGDDSRGNGYQVLLWLEEAVALRGFVPPKLHVHSANPSARLKMLAAIASIERLHARNQEASESNGKPGSKDTAAPFGLLVLRALKLQPLCEFYSALGLTFVREQHGNGPMHYAAMLGASVLEIYPLRAGEPIPTGMRLNFNVLSLDASLAALRAAHGSLLQAPWATPGERHALVGGPEGHTVEIIERVGAGASASVPTSDA